MGKADAATSLSHLRHRQGRRAETRSLLQGICGWFSESFSTADLLEARALLGALGWLPPYLTVAGSIAATTSGAVSVSPQYLPNRSVISVSAASRSITN